MTSGVYKIENSVNGKAYIGSAINLLQRFKRHLGDLRGGTHHSSRLQRSWDKYGEAAFSFKVLLECSKENLIDYEQRCFGSFRPEYNMCPVAGSVLGLKASPEAVANMRAAQKGKLFSLETRAKMRAAQMGNANAKGNPGPIGLKRSEETKAKMRAAQLGNRHCKGRKNALGHRHTPEALAKISAASTRRHALARAKKQEATP